MSRPGREAVLGKRSNTRFEKPSSAAFCKSLIPWLRVSSSKRSANMFVEGAKTRVNSLLWIVTRDRAPDAAFILTAQ